MLPDCLSAYADGYQVLFGWCSSLGFSFPKRVYLRVGPYHDFIDILSPKHAHLPISLHLATMEATRLSFILRKWPPSFYAATHLLDIWPLSASIYGLILTTSLSTYCLQNTRICHYHHIWLLRMPTNGLSSYAVGLQVPLGCCSPIEIIFYLRVNLNQDFINITVSLTVETFCLQASQS